MFIRISGEKLRRKVGKFLFEFMNLLGLFFNVFFLVREERIVKRYKKILLLFK